MSKRTSYHTQLVTADGLEGPLRHGEEIPIRHHIVVPIVRPLAAFYDGALPDVDEPMSARRYRYSYTKTLVVHVYEEDSK